MKVLVVEDERYLAQMIKRGLEHDGFTVDVENDGESGYIAATSIDYDVIVLDVMMPGMSGIEVCKKLRSEKHNEPILLLTALDQNSDVINGLNAGADDYLPKPFSFGVLTARIHALLRRPRDKYEGTMKLDDLEMDIHKKVVKRNGDVINLSPKEFSILEYLIRNIGNTLSKDKIISHVWDFDSDVSNNNLEVFIAHLRNKIDKPYDKHLIHTVHGFGYKLDLA